MTDLKPLQTILSAIEVKVPDNMLSLIIASYEAYKEKKEKITLEEILKIKGS